jgi:hypothetical protein
MRIGITLNEVLRSFISQVAYTYDKYIKETKLTEKDITNFNLLEFFEFEDKNKLNNFLYLEAPLEIFGHADQISDGIMNHFNEFLMEMEYEGEHEIELISREVNKAIPATLFFLSKTGARPNKIRFVKDYSEKWDGVDVLITANPLALEAKPNDKISVKIKTSYNTGSKADFELDSILEFFKNEELRNSILKKTITTNYEEI